jgi:hypothetical protein
MRNTTILFVLFVSSAAAYEIDLTPDHVVARDNPFAHYEGELPSVEVRVTDNGQPVQDVTISLTITHVDNLLLPSGFPWFEGKEVFSVTEISRDGTLAVDALLFPLRGDYRADVKVSDATGNTEDTEFMIEAAEPFKQSAANGIIFLSVLCLFGAVVGYVFGKDFKTKATMMGLMLASVFLLSSIAVFADDDGEQGHNWYEDDSVTFYTTPEEPDIGEQTTFTFIVRDEYWQQVNNAVAYIELANEEEGFTVLELELFSQTGVFSFNYGIFDGAPHIASIKVEPTTMSTPQFSAIESEIPFAGIAHNPPVSAKITALVVMLGSMLAGFVVGVGLRSIVKKGELHE